MNKVVIQSIWLTLAILAFTVFLPGYFGYFGAIILGLIPLLYLKKLLKERVLKINIWSSVIAFVVLVVVYIILAYWFNGLVTTNSTTLRIMLGIVNLRNFLLNMSISIVLFNIPFLIYFFFGKKKDLVDLTKNEKEKHINTSS